MGVGLRFLRLLVSESKGRSFLRIGVLLFISEVLVFDSGFSVSEADWFPNQGFQLPNQDFCFRIRLVFESFSVSESGALVSESEVLVPNQGL